MEEFDSLYTGEQHDEGTGRSIRGGEIDKTHVIKTYGSLAEIGLSAGIETMTMIAQALGDNSRVTYSAAGGNDVADGSAYPVKNGSAVRNGVLTAHRVNANFVFFEYSNAENVWAGFYNGRWSDWAQIYDSRNKPTAADVNALARDGSNEMTGDVAVRKATYPSLRLIAETAGTGGVVQQTSTGLLVRFYDVYGDGNNHRTLMIGDGSDLARALRLAVTKDGVTNYYNILHTGNLTELLGGDAAAFTLGERVTELEDALTMILEGVTE